ncbi:uncharacterized protein LOC121915067 [Sceloporus undulatus]|uniref:uncharacterized protein LOC121915067 n=1 Tax=Sceloporus undulatus TaxID=8520 RepID=UPI001C4C0C4A|nr:uncharacterized protein LOC121915067 [Sceloporus undulatus]
MLPRKILPPYISPHSSQEEYDVIPYQGSPFAPLETKSLLHELCQQFCRSSREVAVDIADSVAENHLELFLEHVLEVDGKECVALMVGVLASSNCNLDKVIHLLVSTISGKPCSFPVETFKQFELKVKAVKFIATLISVIPHTERLDKWATDFNVLFSNFMADHVLFSDGTDTGRFMSLKEIATAIKILDGRWGLMFSIFLKHCSSIS